MGFNAEEGGPEQKNENPKIKVPRNGTRVTVDSYHGDGGDEYVGKRTSARRLRKNNAQGNIGVGQGEIRNIFLLVKNFSR
jgi:hypothetical protein